MTRLKIGYSSNTQAQRRRLRARGAVIVEYAFLLTWVAIPAIGGIAIAGANMLKEYQEARTQLLRPFP